MQRRAASPIITAVKPPQTAINTISNVDSLIVSAPLGSWRPLPGTFEGFAKLWVLIADAVVVACEGLIIIVVVAIELVEYFTLGEDSSFGEPVGTNE